MNSFHSVRGQKPIVLEGKKAEIGIPQARKLFASGDTSHVVGLRDPPSSGYLPTPALESGEVAKLRLSDYRGPGETKSLRFREKGGKEREIPVRHDFEAGSASTSPRLVSPKIRAVLRCYAQPMERRGTDERRLCSALDASCCRKAQDWMLKRWLTDAGHSSPITTRIYDRRKKRVTPKHREKNFDLNAE